MPNSRKDYVSSADSFRLDQSGNTRSRKGLWFLIRLGPARPAVVGLFGVFRIRLGRRGSGLGSGRLRFIFDGHHRRLDLALRLSRVSFSMVRIGVSGRRVLGIITTLFGLDGGLGFRVFFVQGGRLLAAVSGWCFVTLVRGRDLEIDLRSKTGAQRAINVAGHGRRQVAM